MKSWTQLKNYFLNTFKKSNVIIGIVLSFITFSGLIYAVQMATLTTFSPNTTISSSEINQNFQNLNNALATVDSAKVAGIGSGFQFTSTVPQYLSFSVVRDSVDGNSGMSTQLMVTQAGYYDLRLYLVGDSSADATGSPQISLLINDVSADFAPYPNTMYYSNYSITMFYSGVYFSGNSGLKLRGEKKFNTGSTNTVVASKSFIYLKKIF